MLSDVTGVDYVSCPGTAHDGNDHMVITYVCQGTSVLLPQAIHAPA